MMEDVYKAVGAVPRDDISFENVIKPLIDIEGEVHTKTEFLWVSAYDLKIDFPFFEDPLPSQRWKNTKN